MHTIKLGRYEFGFELWSGVFRLQEWQLGYEHRADKWRSRLVWFGPFHLAACRLH